MGPIAKKLPNQNEPITEPQKHTFFRSFVNVLRFKNEYFPKLYLHENYCEN